MSTATSTTVVGTFPDRLQANRAVEALRDAGFPDRHLGLLTRGEMGYSSDRAKDTAVEENTETGVLAGAASGAGLGALVGLGILAGVIPVLGPALAAGTLGVILTNAAGGAAIAGLAGALIGWGIPEEDARHYETEFTSGRTIVTVEAEDRAAEANDILRRFGASSRGRSLA
jgi:hypothetical protein